MSHDTPTETRTEDTEATEATKSEEAGTVDTETSDTTTETIEGPEFYLADDEDEAARMMWNEEIGSYQTWVDEDAEEDDVAEHVHQIGLKNGVVMEFRTLDDVADGGIVFRVHEGEGLEESMGATKENRQQLFKSMLWLAMNQGTINFQHCEHVEGEATRISVEHPAMRGMIARVMVWNTDGPKFVDMVLRTIQDLHETLKRDGIIE